MDDVWVEYLGTANTELIGYVRALRPRVRTGILSNSFVGAREREAAAYGFPDLVDEIVYSHEVGLQKPDPGVYELTCQRLGVAPDEMVFVDNVPVCVDAARALGIHGVLFEDNAGTIAAIEALLAG
jgi:putative hydrolase of the HAD superfamily